MFLATFSIQWDGTELWREMMPNTLSMIHKALPEAHLAHPARKSDKGKSRGASPFPTVPRKSCFSCTGGTHSPHPTNRAPYRGVQWQTHWKGVTPPPRAQQGSAGSTAQSRNQREHTSFRGSIQSEAEISTSYQFSLDNQLLSLWSRPCCFQGPAVHHMCTVPNFIFSSYWKPAPLPQHPQNADELCILCWTKPLQLSTSLEALIQFWKPQIPSLWHYL